MRIKTILIFWMLFGVLFLSWCDNEINQIDQIKKNTMEKTNAMEKINTNMQKTNNIQEINYKAYSEEIVKSEIWSGKKVILFFAASRCPSCRNLDEEIINNIKNIPNDIIILKVDYDNSKNLKIKYWVTSQHTLVYIDKDQNLLKKMTWWSFDDTIWLVK